MQIIRSAVSFIVTAIVARILGPSGYGVATSIFVFAGLFSFAIDPGFGGSVVRYISVYSGSSKDYIPIVSGFLIYRMVVSLMLAIAFYIIAPWFAILTGASEHAAAFQVFALSIFLGSIYSGLRAYLYGIGYINLASLYYSIGFIIGNVSSLILVLSGFGILGYVLGFVIGDVVQFSIYIYALRNLIIKCIRVKLGDAVKGLRIILPLSLTLLGSRLMNFLYEWFDRALVLGLLGTYDLGLYNVALRLSSIFGTAKHAVTTALTPYYGNLYGAKGVEAIRPRVKRISKLVSLTYTPAVLTIAGLTPILIPLIYGSRFIESWRVAFVHLVFIALMGFEVAYGGIALITEAKRDIVVSSMIKSVSSIALELLLTVVAGLGALGVIIGKNLGALASFLYLYLVLFRSLRLGLNLKYWIMGVFTGILILILTMPLILQGSNNGLWYITPIIALIIYTLLLRILKPIDNTDIKILREALGTRLQKIANIIENVLDVH